MEIQVANRQRRLRVPTDWLANQAQLALPLCLELPGPQEPVLHTLEHIEISLLSDIAMAKIHGRFLHDPTPTDVITFPYGEILLGVETIERNAFDHAQGLEQELLRCVVHGMLHLNGYEDYEAKDAAQMIRRQEKILKMLEGSTMRK